MKLPDTIVNGLQAAINRYLALDPQIMARLASLEGRRIGIDLRGPDIMLCLQPTAHGLRLSAECSEENDTVLHGTPLGLARLGLGGNTEKSLFSGDVVISGDVETGQAFKQILDDMDVDWEEHLSHVTGDIIAHQIGRGLRHAGDWLARSSDSLQRDTGEYLKAELQLLPERIEISNFIADVDTLAMDVERLAARISRLLAGRKAS